MRFKHLIISVFLIIYSFSVFAQNKGQEIPKEERLAWFKDAKLGIFIHWGIYSVNGVTESWSFFNDRISHEDYMKQLDGFDASNYKPKEWVKLIQESGAKYTVLTSKHHDGVALWDSKVKGNINTKKDAKAKRDLLTPFVDAVRETDLKLGLYYSLIDWTYPDYPNFTRKVKRYEKDEKRLAKFTKYNFEQLKEIGKYHPDLYWFDGDWELSAEQFKAPEIRQLILENTPKTVINSRLKSYGDYATPEQGVPVHQPKDKYWELCMTINDSWGFQHTDNNYKSANQIIRIFADCISMGGNLLLDIGPKADGSIDPRQEAVLKELGRWTKKHKNAIYGSRAGVNRNCYSGYSTISKDKKKLFLFVDGKPSGPILLKGLKNNIKAVWVEGEGSFLTHKVIGKADWRDVPGLVYIDVPEKVLDKQLTVITLLLDGEIDIFSDEITPIESN